MTSVETLAAISIEEYDLVVLGSGAYHGQSKSDKNMDVMLMANTGSGPIAAITASNHYAAGNAHVDYVIVPQVQYLKQINQKMLDAAKTKYSNAWILLYELQKNTPWEWWGHDVGKGHDDLATQALPVTQVWYINTGGANDSATNQRIPVVVGVGPGGKLIKAWKLIVTVGPKWKGSECNVPQGDGC